MLPITNRSEGALPCSPQSSPVPYAAFDQRSPQHVGGTSTDTSASLASGQQGCVLEDCGSIGAVGVGDGVVKKVRPWIDNTPTTPWMDFPPTPWGDAPYGFACPGSPPFHSIPFVEAGDGLEHHHATSGTNASGGVCGGGSCIAGCGTNCVVGCMGTPCGSACGASIGIWPPTPTPSNRAVLQTPNFSFGMAADGGAHVMPPPSMVAGPQMHPPPRVAAMAAAAAAAAAGAAAAAAAACGVNAVAAGADQPRPEVQGASAHIGGGDSEEDYISWASQRYDVCAYTSAASATDGARADGVTSRCRRPEPVLVEEVSDEEDLDALVPPPGSVLLAHVASRGSVLHGTGKCRPCAWFWKPQRCTNYQDCGYCHQCPQGELKSRKKSKVAAMRLGALVPQHKSVTQQVGATLQSARVLKLSPLI
eukprot:TRINITY_DN50430_c0_g1_i1.p1 TRINITY_DN50430_c0_g1~~TRINITY_DN50430_c0_g1_i1.p1  ORF type:complete len:437 (+),score=59.90 TRINITY_DN50430_c0_g1_i1:54-1313(+)